MMATQGSRRAVVWAIIGGLVLIAGILAIVISSISGQSSPPPPTGTTPNTQAPTPSSTPAGEFVDPTAADHGWRPEPITSDAESYIVAALETASTFDTQQSTREEWLSYLETWFTPDTRYASDADREADMTAAKLELRQGVVLPEEDWDALAGEDGRVVAIVAGDVTIAPVPEDSSGDMSIGTAEVTMTFTSTDGNGGEASYDAQVRVSVQVLCGAESIPTPDTAQQAGDCKVVRYFTEPLEP